MAIVAMKKVQVVTLKSSQKKVFDYLQTLNAFEFVDAANDLSKGCVSALREVEKRVADFDFVIKFLKPYYKDSRGLSYALMGEKEVMNRKRVEEIAKQFNFDEVIATAQSIEVAQNQNASKIQEVEKELAYLAAFESLGFSLQDTVLESVRFIFGRVKTPVYTLMKEEIVEECAEVEFQEIHSNEAETAFFVVVHKESEQIVRDMFRKREVVEVVFAEACNNVKHYIADQKLQLDKYEKESRELVNQAENLAQELPKVKACYDYFSWAQESEDLSARAGYTDYTVIFEGWIEASRLKKVQIELAQITQNEAVIEQVEAMPEDEAPVEIRNSSIFAPFEAVTRMYGLPKVHELDPTPYLALFFLVFFGFCLTDAIYGLVLAGICFGALMFMKVPREIKGLLQLIGLGGIATALLGVVFGGYAGIPVESLPSFIAKMQLINTANSDGIMTAMMLAFGLGFFQLWFGTLIAGVHTWKSGQKMEAVSLHFSWTIFFGLMVFAQFGGLDAQMAQYLQYFAVAFIILGLGHESKNIFLKPLVGAFRLIEQVIGWGSGILSYARLFALGLATGVIAMVFNQIGFILGGLVPGVGIVLTILIIIFGHVLNIGINVLGAFIHSARLQFVEFFGKFMEGGGRTFKPFKKKSTYVYIES